MVPILEGLKVTKKFGGLVALKEVDFAIYENEIVGLIGPNGAGKTTLINCITGFFPPTSGSIHFQGKRIDGLKPHKICEMGIARTFQIPRPFPKLTVLENVLVASRGDKDRAILALDFVGLKDKINILARNLNTQQLKLLDLARALATNPKILLLDEMIAGLNPVEITNLVKKIMEIRENGITILWIEHVMRAIMSCADRIIVLNEGMKIAEGTPKEVSNDEKVIKAYLGEKYYII
jgi:branched-chain amino acid transport system ATP-binding protein